jgi:hypothetical protein
MVQTGGKVRVHAETKRGRPAPIYRIVRIRKRKEKTATWELAEPGSKNYRRTKTLRHGARGVLFTDRHADLGTRGHLCRVLITASHTGRSGERPHTALSDAGVVRPLIRDRYYVGSASPDSMDGISFTPSLAKAAGRISARALGPDPRLVRSRASAPANEAPSSQWSDERS